MYSQSDIDLFNSIKANHPELALHGVDVLPVQNGTYDGNGNFIPDGTYTIDALFFPPAAMSFYNDLVNQKFFK